MLSNITRDGVLTAIAEFDELGRAAFLEKYGFGEAQAYLLEHKGKQYDSKAIVGAAHGYSGSDLEPLRNSEFTGGEQTVAALLRRLGFAMADDTSSLTYWWVNQGKTYRAERDGEFVWAPQKAKNGAALAHHKAVRKLRVGDVVVHYAEQHIRAIGVVQSDGYEANQPASIDGHEWAPAGYRADVEYHELVSPIQLSELDAAVRAGAGGPFNSSGGVNQGYMYELPERVRSLLVSEFADRLPLSLGADGRPRFVAVYVGQTSVPNLHYSLPRGVWGWKAWQDDYSDVRPGDLIAFGVGFSGGSPRVQPDEWLGERFERFIVGTVTTEVDEHRTPYWPDERNEVIYPWRLEFGDTTEHADMAIESLDSVYGEGVAEAFRLSATGGGKGVIVPVDQPRTNRKSAFEPKPFDETVEALTEAINHAGIVFPPSFVRDVATALATKRFLILTGLSGSGKTLIAKAIGEWFGNDQSLIVPVRPDWTSPDALLGYENVLSESTSRGHAWVVPAALQFVLQAHHDPDRPYLLLLDEMNLAHVERYFADVLSGIESKQAVIPNLEHGVDGWRRANGPELVPLPSNLFVVGTVNVDETTYMFSPKVLDRANTIEFRVLTDDLAGASGSIEPVQPGDPNITRSFLETSRTASAHTPETDFSTSLLQLHELLSSFGREFGHRGYQEMCRFAELHSAAGVDDLFISLDSQLLQKVIPKLHGSIRELQDPLEALGAWSFYGPDGTPSTDFDVLRASATEAVLPRSFDKIQRMAKKLRANHFVSFAE